MTKALILAGGLGFRLRGVVSNLPKPMADVAGRPFLEYLMDYWTTQGVTEFILSVGYMKDLIVAHFGSNYRGTPVKYIEESEPLGTGGGLLLALQYISEPFLLLNGDTFFKIKLDDLVAFHKRVKSSCTLSLFRTTEMNRYGGVDIDACGKIHAFNPLKSDASFLANGGVYYINPELLKNCRFKLGKKYSFEDEMIPYLIKNKMKFYGLECNAKFIDIGIPKDYFKSQDIIKS